TNSFSTNYGYAVRTDSNGDTLWTKGLDLGPHSYHQLNGVKERANQTEFIFCGAGNWYTGGYPKSMHLKTDLNGNVIYRMFSSQLDDVAVGITNTTDGGYATIGWLGNYGWRALMIKYDS